VIKKEIYHLFKKGNIILLYIFALCFSLSCAERKKEVQKPEKLNYSEKLINVNKLLVDKDADIIRKYIARRNWQMQTTETGLWYMISEKGNGKKAVPNKVATILYKVYLLDGTLCYSSEKTGPKKFTLGKGGVEGGLEEGVLLLHCGDKAQFIMPPHLAQGLMGDGNRIPPRSTILYEVELIQISDSL
jgi:FKBP-type peptidyl-prolyl cis-trans isomerase